MSQGIVFHAVFDEDRCPTASRPFGIAPRNSTATPSASARQTTPDTVEPLTVRRHELEFQRRPDPIGSPRPKLGAPRADIDGVTAHPLLVMVGPDRPGHAGAGAIAPRASGCLCRFSTPGHGYLTVVLSPELLTLNVPDAVDE